MTQKTRYTVIGAGHGVKAMAAHLALMDFPTTLYNRTPEHIAAIKELQGIELESSESGPRGFGKLKCVTSSIAEALAQAEMEIDTHPIRPLAMGRHLIERGIQPGPAMDDLLKKAFDAQTEGDFETTEDGVRWILNYLGRTE